MLPTFWNMLLSSNKLSVFIFIYIVSQHFGNEVVKISRGKQVILLFVSKWCKTQKNGTKFRNNLTVENCGRWHILWNLERTKTGPARVIANQIFPINKLWALIIWWFNYMRIRKLTFLCIYRPAISQIWIRLGGDDAHTSLPCCSGPRRRFGEI